MADCEFCHKELNPNTDGPAAHGKCVKDSNERMLKGRCWYCGNVMKRGQISSGHCPGKKFADYPGPVNPTTKSNP